MTNPQRVPFIRAMKAVFWSFFGVRKGRDHDRDMAQLRPVQVIVAGVLGALLFVLALLLIVHGVVE